MDVRKGSAWKTIEYGEIFIGGAWRRLKYGEAYLSGAWKQIVSFIPALTLAISPSSVGASGGATMTDAATATPTGGLGPFTYAWTLVSNDGVTSPAATSPTTATTRFTGSATDGHSGTATFRCTCTDSLGTTATADVAASWFIFAGGGGTGTL
jgi:hypothetical protein